MAPLAPLALSDVWGEDDGERERLYERERPRPFGEVGAESSTCRRTFCLGGAGEMLRVGLRDRLRLLLRGERRSGLRPRSSSDLECLGEGDGSLVRFFRGERSAWEARSGLVLVRRRLLGVDCPAREIDDERDRDREPDVLEGDR